MKNLFAIVLTAAFLLPRVATGQQPDRNPKINLHRAVLEGHIEAVKQHIEAGSNLDEKDAYGSTPLIIAVTFGRNEIADTLIRAGADLTIRNSEGSTPLHLAALFARKEIVRTLLDYGANKYTRNNEGATAFDIVAAPFRDDKWIYDRISQGLAPLGLKLDYNRIEASRPEIAEMLRATPAELEKVKFRPSTGGNWIISTPEDEKLNPEPVAELYLEASKLENIYGLLVIRNGRLIGEKYFSRGSIDYKARLQSVTKSYTSAITGLALEQGCLTSLDQRMIEFFPEFADSLEDPRKDKITIRHLLQMRAGYPWEESTPELFTMLYKGFRPSLLVHVPLSSDPGTRFEYSNLSSHLVGIIVARACNQDLKPFAREHLFSPLEVEAGEWIRDWEGYYNGHGDLHFTARDAARFGLLYLNNGTHRDKQIVPAEWVRESLESYSEDVNSAGVSSGSVGRYFRHIGYGYQWWSARVDTYRFNFAWGHGGQLIILLPEQKMVIVVISDPLFKQHNDEAWRLEKSNINLVGKFIYTLPRE